MKSIGCKFEYQRDRDCDLMRAFRESLSGNPGKNLPEILRITVNCPSKRFWVSEFRAAIVISKIMHGDRLDTMTTTKREMYLELYHRVVDLKKKYPEKTLSELAVMATNQPAPKFYLKPESAGIIIHRIKKRWLKERKQNLRHLF